jgi:hypothetical protein
MKSSTWFLLAAGFLSVACTPPADSPSDGDANSEEDTDTPTWYADVKPLMETHCVGCHQEGSVGTFSLDTLDSVSLISEYVADAVQTRRMPPWKAVDGCTDYRDDISLSDDQIDTIVGWIDAGLPAGDAAAAIAGQVREPGELERVDLQLQLPVAYSPSATATDDYRCFPIPWPEDEDTFVTGFVVNPGNEMLVHHVIAYIAPAGYADALIAEEALDGQPGYDCFGGPGVIEQVDSEWLGAWAPGATQGNFPNGVGVQMSAGDWVVLQVHYNNSTGITAEDQTSIDFQIESEVERYGWIQPFTDPLWVYGIGMDIPAQTDGVTHSYDYELSNTLEAHSASLHMHRLGTKASMKLTKADGTVECLLEIDDWDFDWQRSYVFAKKKEIAPGDVWSVSCEWDNPTDEDVAWGDGTGDEMCLGSMLLSLP